MFGLFGKKPSVPKSCTLMFDEAFCHSAGADMPVQEYKIGPGTTEIVFAFGDFEAFWQTYINRSGGISNETRQAMADGRALFIGAVVQDGQYFCLNGVNERGEMLLNATSLQPFGAKNPFTLFGSGAIMFGIYHVGELRVEALWATLYSQ